MRRAREGPRVPIRRQAGARRRPESEARFRALVQHATDVITVLDAAGAIRYTSPAVASVLGYRPEERLAGSAFDLIHPDDALAARQALARLLRAPDLVECLALRLRHRDGAWRHLEVTAKNLLADPAVRGIVVNYRDATARRAAEEARAAGERLLRAGFDRSVLGIALADTAGTILASNPALQRLLGYDAAALRGLGLRDLTHPDDLAPNLDRLAELLAGRRDHYSLEKRYRHRAGRAVWGRVTVSALPDAAGRPEFLVAMVEDISARKDAEAALRRQHAHLAALHDTALALLAPRAAPADLLGDIVARAGALVGTPDGYIYLREPGDDAMTVRVGVGIFRDGVGSRIRHGEGLGGRVWATGRPLAVAEYDAWPGRKPGMAPGRFRAIAGVPLTAGGAVVGVIGLAHVAPGRHFGAEELAILGRFGALASLALEHARLHDAARRELAEREAAERRLAHQATHDPLTGLPNRTLFHERLGLALGRVRPDGPPCAVLFLDLDHFKEVNDTLGHDAGDHLLRAVAARLRAAVREGDTVARLGGDEFAVLVPAVADAAGAVEVAERLRQALAPPIPLDGRPFPVGTSIGIAVGGPGYTRAEELLRDADVALYRAKAAGRGGHAVFHPRMQLQLLARAALEEDLARALAGDEFVLHYQPLVDLASGRVVEVEALVRWRCPGEGLIPPERFLAVLEGTGRIGDLDRWALRAACRQARRWHQGDPAGAPRVGVNLAPATLRTPGLVGEVVAALAEAGARPAWLRLEITEGAALADVAGVAATLRALRGLGVGLALDDFGTGYSSLAHLQRLPVDTLKLDRAFFGAGEAARDRAIVRAVTELARGLGLAVVAEGLETAAQVAWARDAGCDQGQGYYFAPALPPEELDRLLVAGPLVEPRGRRAADTRPPGV